MGVDDRYSIPDFKSVGNRFIVSLEIGDCPYRTEGSMSIAFADAFPGGAKPVIQPDFQ